jgi:hypothetical protein
MSGNTCEIIVSVTDENDLPYDFSNHTVIWRLRKSTSTGVVKITKDTVNGGISLSLGIVSIFILPEDTTGFTSGTYYHELVGIRKDTLETETICYGYVTLLKSGIV